MVAQGENSGANIATEKTNIGVWGPMSQCKQTDSSVRGETSDFRRRGKIVCWINIVDVRYKITLMKCVTGEIGATTISSGLSKESNWEAADAKIAQSHAISPTRGDSQSWHFKMELDPFVNARGTDSPNVQKAFFGSFNWWCKKHLQSQGCFLPCQFQWNIKDLDFQLETLLASWLRPSCPSGRLTRA